MNTTKLESHGAVAGQVERGVRPHAEMLARRLQAAAYNHGYEDAHPSNATTRQDKTDTVSRQTLADLLIAIAALANDAPPRDPHHGGSSYEASMLRNLLARIHRDGGHYVEQHGLDKALEDAEAKVVAWLAPVTTEQVVAAIYAVGAEAARRGEMYPQTRDEQLEDRHSVARVAEMLQWYEKNTGCARLKGWPGA